MVIVYIAIGISLAYLIYKQLDKDANGEVVKQKDSELAAKSDQLSIQIDELKKKADQVEDKRDDKENYWNK